MVGIDNTPSQKERDELNKIYPVSHDYIIRLEKETAELQDQNETLENQNRILEKLYSNLAHELKTPIISIRGFSELVLEDAEHLDAATKRHFEYIHRNIIRLEKMIEQMRYTSHTGKFYGEAENIDIYPLLNDLLKERYTPEKENEIYRNENDNIIVIIEKNLPQIKAHDENIFSIYKNLIENAEKYAPHENQEFLEITIGYDSEKSHFYVRDNGKGIDLSKFHNPDEIFERHKTTEGTGLGLDIIRDIINKYVGEIHAESEPYKGTRIYFTLGEDCFKLNKEIET